MQTLQQARLTSKPPPLPGPSTSSGFSALAKAYDPSNKPPLVKAGGILRHRTINPLLEEPKPAEPDVKTIELLSRFFLSSGVPLETVQERTFLDLVRHINPKIVLPEKSAMTKCVEKLSATTKPLVNFQKTVGPLCVTIDTDGTDDEKYLVFSIHYFEDLYERKHLVYLRKLLLSELDAESLLISVRRAVNNYTYNSVKFSNMVCPNDTVYELVFNSDAVKRYHVCFYHYMKQFVVDLMEIEEFSSGLTDLREFVRYIKKNAVLYGKFRRMQLSKNAELDCPMIDDGPWENTCVFLTRCLVLHDTFTDFCERFNVTCYINNTQFNQLVYFQRLLSECVKHCRELSTPNSSISQVIPAVISLQRYIKNNDMGYRYTRIIRESLHTCFGNYLDGNMTLLYEMATLMDARYAYRDVLTPLRWKQLELKVAEDFVRADATMEKCFYQDLSQMSPEYRRTTIMAEFAHYRQVSFIERPEESESPFLWWGRRHTDMEFLAVMAREYLAAPAVSVDATYYFANGGKFQHLCNTYSYGELESCLSLAGAHQKFVGRGASVDNITNDMIESLNSTANRLQKRTYFGLYTQGCDDVSTDREVAEIIGQPYPPLPTMAVRGHGPPQEDKPPTLAMPTGIRRVVPQTQPVRQTKPSAITARPIQYKGAALGAVPKAIPIRHVPLQKLQPSQQKPMEEEKPAVFDQTAISKTPYWPQPKPIPQEEKPKNLLLEKEVKQEPVLEKVKDEPLEEEPTTSVVGEVSNRKMSPLPTPANIIQHQQQKMQPNSPTLSQQGPPSTIIQANGILTKRIIKNIHAPMPQNITPHNFVQKFAQKQNFVQKFTNRGVPQVPQANVQPPGGIRSQMTFGKPAQPSSSALPLHEPKIEEPLLLAEQPDDFKMEPLDDFDDFNIVDDYSAYIGPPVTTVHCEALNDQSVANAYARHRMNVELQKRRTCNRRCAVCGHLEQHELLKNVTIDNEKLLIMLGCIYRGEFNLVQAQIFMSRDSKTYICRVHFGETLDEIHTMLHLRCAEDIHTCSVDMITSIMLTITQLRPHVTAQQLRKILYDFAERYKHLKDTRNDLMGPLDEYSRSKPHREPNDVDEQEIIPKVYRQPRKQVLEADQHDGTVKVIEQEDFKLPTAKPSDHEDCDNPGVCCFCSKHGDRKCMLKVPRSEDRLARWVEKLGPEFEKRLKSGSDNLICRQHFPEAAFSSRGRLLKGMIPDAEPEKVEVTYRIQGNKFLKLDEQKSGTDKKSSIDLEKGHSDRQDEARMRKRIAETNEFERQLNIQDHEVSPERSLSPVEMSPQPTTSAAAETRASETRVQRIRKSVNRSLTPDDGGKLAKNDTDYKPEPKRRGRPPKKAQKRKAETPPPEEEMEYEDEEDEEDEEEFSTADDDDFVPDQEIRRSRRMSRKAASGSDSDDGPVRYIESRTGLKTVKVARKMPTRNANKQ